MTVTSNLTARLSHNAPGRTHYPPFPLHNQPLAQLPPAGLIWHVSCGLRAYPVHVFGL